MLLVTALWTGAVVLIVYDAIYPPKPLGPAVHRHFQRLRSAMLFSSTVWIILIGVGGVLAAIGTVNFNIARDREKASTASQKAIALLKQEIARNLVNIDANRQASAKNEVMLASFETAAWTITLNAGLLAEVDQPTLDAITDIYYRIELAEGHRRRILENSQGVVAALVGSGARVKQYQAFLLQTLNELEPQLRRFVELHP